MSTTDDVRLPGHAPGERDGLDAVFAPRSVAVIGASDDPGRIGGRVLARLLEHFRGPVYPVNARRETVQGRQAYTTIAGLPETPDLAVVAVPAAQVLPVVESLAQLGCRAAIVLSSGFAELGDDGRRHQDELRSIARRSGMRIVGPNCVGTVSLPVGLVATFADLRMRDLRSSDRPGVAIVSQSGALGAVFFQAADALGVRVTHVCTTGNEADVTAAEAIRALVERPEVNTVMVFLEAMREPELLYAAGRRAMELGKPIVAMKAGVSEVGAQAAASHSGSLAAPDRFAQALFDRAGIIRADSPLELLNMAAAFAGGRLPAGDRVAVMTLSGGVGIMIADELDRWGLALPNTSDESVRRLTGLIPDYGSTRNPIDYTANAVNDPESFAEILDVVAHEERFDMICLNGLSMATFDQSVAAIESIWQAVDKPIVVSMSGAAPVRFNEVGIPCVADSIQTAKALGGLHRYTRLRALEPGRAPLLGAGRARGGGTRTLDGPRTRALLSSYGVPVVAESGVVGVEAAVAAAVDLGFPVAVKLDPTVSEHKTEVGGLRLGLRTADEVRGAAREMSEAVGSAETAFVVQRMVDRGIELTVGAIRDPDFGPGVLVGLGGVLVEVLDQVRMELVPVDHAAAERAIRAICGGRLTGSTRGLGTRETAELSAIVVGVSAMLEEHPEIVEVDVNPLIVGPDGMVAVDGLVRVEGVGTVG